MEDRNRSRGPLRKRDRDGRELEKRKGCMAVERNYI